MSPTLLLDFENLLTPIAAKHPAGKNLRQNNSPASVYHKIKDARTQARTIERQHMQGTEKATKANWQVVQQLAVEILTSQSKDLEIATWLIEALLREHGFSGLSEGFKLVHNLCEHFWETLHPLPDEDGIISRIICLTGLNGEEVDGSLLAPIALIPLTEANATEPYALWHYHQALDLLKVAHPDKRAQRVAAGGITLDMIETALNRSSTDFLQTQRQALNQCITEYQRLTQFLEQKCGHDAPPSSRILKQLTSCIDCLNCSAHPVVSETTTTSNLSIEIVPANENAIKSTASREQILQTLLHASNFFKTTEPHSPLPYLLERAVRWAKMPLPLLLQELIQDENAREKVGSLTGISFEK